MNKADISNIIMQQAVLPLFFHKDSTVCTEVMRSLYGAGIKAIEYTNRGEAAFANFKQMKAVRDAELPGLFIGIGTIKNRNQARAFIEAGADYLISPGLVAEVAEEAAASGTLYSPGCMTPSEIIAAENMGLDLIKIFPGNVLGTGFISAIKEIFPSVSFMVTGGVEPTEDNLKGWFNAGVSAVGMGSKLITKQLLEAKDYEGLEKATAQLLTLISKVR